jgi:hypothetical protein
VIQVRGDPRQGQADGDVTQDANIKALAEFVATILAGMSARARDGATLDQLEASMRLVVNSWPSAKRSPRSEFLGTPDQIASDE